MSDPVLKSTVKYRNHPSILKNGEVCHSSNAINFSFSTVQRKQILKEITNKFFKSKSKYKYAN